MNEKDLDSSMNPYQEEAKPKGYIRQLQWDMAIGLQQVDNLKPSKYLEQLKEKNIKRNKKFLNEFKNEMQKQNLSPKTIDKHLSNIEFYLNDYLTYYDITKMEDGVYEINMFLGDFFIRKCLWSSVSSIKENASSIKKFYKCMYELNHIDKESYEHLCLTIKENMDDWLEELKKYDDEIDEDFF